MKQIFKDTMQTPNGRWSMKRITILVVLIFTLSLGTYIVVKGSKDGIQVFDSLLLFESLLLGVNEASKKLLNKNIKDDSTGTSEEI